jgi:hypothetical protein
MRTMLAEAGAAATSDNGKSAHKLRKAELRKEVMGVALPMMLLRQRTQRRARRQGSI